MKTAKAEVVNAEVVNEVPIEEVLGNTIAGQLYREYSAACDDPDKTVRKSMGKVNFRMARDGMSPVGNVMAWAKASPVLDVVFAAGSIAGVGLAGYQGYRGIFWVISKFRGA